MQEMSLIPGLGRSLGEGNGNPLQYSCLKNSMNREECGRLESMGLQESDMLERLTFSLFFFLFTVHSTTDTLLVYVSKGFFGCSLKKRVLELQRWKQRNLYPRPKMVMVQFQVMGAEWLRSHILGMFWKIKSTQFVDVGHEKDRRGTDFSKFSIWEIGRTDTIFPKWERLLKEQI